MNDLNKTIKYLSECYQSDNHETGLINFFSSKVEKPKILPEAGELLNGEMPFLPVGNNKYSTETLKTLQLYKKEKELFLGAFFIIGSASNYEICAPLLLYPANINEKTYLDEEFGYTVTYKPEEVKVNLPVLREVIKDSESGSVDLLLKGIKGVNIDFAELTKIKKLLDKHTVLNTENLLMFPELLTQRKLKNKFKSIAEVKDEFVILPACGVGIVSKSTDSRGLINELNFLSESKTFSKPIQAIYSELQEQTYNENTGLVPSVLSSAQNQIIQSASKYPFSVIVGPPGTGKTYTISSLAIEQISKGNSVLIVSRTDEAVDVVEKKIKEDIKIDNITIRGGKSDHLRLLKKHIENLLKGLYNEDLKISSPLDVQKTNLRKKGNGLLNIEKRLQKEIQKSIKSSNFLFYSSESVSFWRKIKVKYYNYSQKNKPLLNTILEKYENSLVDYQLKVSKYISDHYKDQINSVLNKNRSDLQTFLKSLRARRGSRKEELQEQFDFETLLKTFPIWLTRITDISRVLPIKEELFDVAIVDEATQCDMASLLPVFQRAKKVVLAGDPNQLKHVSFLSTNRQFLIAQKVNDNTELAEEFNYRKESILDYAIAKTSNQNQISFLNEHFRSVSSIISFSNKNFYDNKLLVMTQKPANRRDEGVKLIRLEGKRDKNGVNVTEVEALIETLRELINAQKDLSKDLCNSIGVLSPLRAQVDALSKVILQKFSMAEIDKHDLMIGTAYAFQGQERDIMLLSFCVDNESHHSAFMHCNKPDVFNVSITRAKKTQIVYHSLNEAQLNTKYLIRQFIEEYSSSDYSQNPEESKEGKDEFLNEICAEIEPFGWQTWPGFFIAGQVVDILVKTNKGYFGIDLIGFPGEYEQAFTIDR